MNDIIVPTNHDTLNSILPLCKWNTPSQITDHWTVTAAMMMLTTGDASPLLFWKTRKRPNPTKSMILKSLNTTTKTIRNKWKEENRWVSYYDSNCSECHSQWKPRKRNGRMNFPSFHRMMNRWTRSRRTWRKPTTRQVAGRWRKGRSYSALGAWGWRPWCAFFHLFKYEVK